jgi:hypothetical protein
MGLPVGRTRPIAVYSMFNEISGLKRARELKVVLERVGAVRS